MTLIACLHPHECRTLLADVLLSSASASAEDRFVSPTRTYISPQALRRLAQKPTALRRKVIEITPELFALWAGSYEEARIFAAHATDWFDQNGANEDSADAFLRTYYQEAPPRPFHAILAPSAEHWLYRIGDVSLGEAQCCGQYAVAGSGLNMFVELVHNMRSRTTPEVRADADGLKIANDLLAREIADGSTILSGFGCGYEIFYRGANGFDRVDDIEHYFALATVLENTIEISHYPHTIRQWYQADQLCIASMATPYATEQGQAFQAFAVPSILQEVAHIIVDLDFFAAQPKYMCIHHLFLFRDARISSTLTIGGDAIGDFFIRERRGDHLILNHTEKYAQNLLSEINKFRDHLRNAPVVEADAT